MLKVTSQLDDEVEVLIHRVIGYCIKVHRELGPGLLERIYRRAVCIELKSEGVPFDVEKSFPVWYRGHLLCDQRVDIVVAGKILLEMKAIDRLAPVHHAQVMSYLRVSGLRIGLLMNFNVRVLPDGLRRIVL
jgi:GxxExxY protein